MCIHLGPAISYLIQVLCEWIIPSTWERTTRGSLHGHLGSPTFLGCAFLMRTEKAFVRLGKGAERIPFCMERTC